MSPREEARKELMSTPEDAGAEMARYAITRVPADMFHYREYRHATLGDALAQARRDATVTSSEPK